MMAIADTTELVRILTKCVRAHQAVNLKGYLFCDDKGRALGVTTTKPEALKLLASVNQTGHILKLKPHGLFDAEEIVEDYMQTEYPESEVA